MVVPSPRNQGRVPLAFIVTGLVFLALFAVRLAAVPGDALLPFGSPALLPLVHLLGPGVLLSVCLGAVQQLGPVVLGVPLRDPAWSRWLLWCCHAAGVSLIVSGFWIHRDSFVLAGGCLLLLTVAGLALGVASLFLQSKRRDAIAWSLPLAAAWLVFAVLCGFLLAWNRLEPFLAAGSLPWLKVHAHAALGGFFLTLLQGVTFQVVPMFVLAEVRHRRLLSPTLAASQTGLVLLVSGFAAARPALVVAGGALILTGLVLSGWCLAATLATRRKRHLEPGLRSFIAGGVALLCACLLGFSLLLVTSGPKALAAFTSLYGAGLLLLALPLLILGVLFKIVPFLVWMDVYGPWVGKRQVPLAPSLSRPWLASGWWSLHLSAAVLLLISFFVPDAGLDQIAALGFAVATSLLLADLGLVLAHLFRTPANALPFSSKPPASS